MSKRRQEEEIDKFDSAKVLNQTSFSLTELKAIASVIELKTKLINEKNKFNAGKTYDEFKKLFEIIYQKYDSDSSNEIFSSINYTHKNLNSSILRHSFNEKDEFLLEQFFKGKIDISILSYCLTSILSDSTISDKQFWMIKMLLDEGAELDKKCLIIKIQYSYLLMDFLCKSRSIKILNLLTERDCETISTTSLLHKACQYDFLEGVELALKLYNNPKSFCDDWGRTPIFYCKSLALMQQIYDNDQEIELKDKYGVTPIMYASTSPRNIELFKFLLDKNASLEMVSDENDNIFHLICSAIRQESLEMLNLICKKKNLNSINDLNARYEKGYQPLDCILQYAQYCSEEVKFSIYNKMVQMGARHSPNFKIKPYHFAVQQIVKTDEEKIAEECLTHKCVDPDILADLFNAINI